MNAGRDVERLIAGWLDEEAAARAPDRVLDGARDSIRTTGQRRFVVAWREPMYMSPLRLAGMAGVFAVALVGAAVFGRLTASPGAGSPPTQTATPAPAASAEVTLGAYRAARNEICTRYVAEAAPLLAGFDGAYDPGLSAAQRAEKVASLRQFADLGPMLMTELSAMAVPDNVRADHARNIAQYQDVYSLIRQIIDRYQAGDFAAAQAIDKSTDPISRDIQIFEGKYGLVDCP